ncbi:L,D-transpeptidase family protein [Xanthobacter agilis]|uniref:Murein L,D-transpeptidase YafK n=1 Tax=Xanthobacter agilis TaxID=47492 RepID=A0ABU0LHA0_XANAG|nr:murein L,D-transpeptidase family protein [Xanthobacter agilis]MDQ0506473.1 murein L,D-transpeptidase YafK [Xanthobacter agilis]
MSRPKTIFSSRVRMAALAVTAALALSACNQTDEVARKANKPLSPQMVSLIGEKNMTPATPLLVRIFKEEAELEVWKQTTSGDYALLKTYPICRWSGELGPKVKMGDRQAPEGFYTISPGQMNPNSNYYLSFNLGFPNAFDKSYGRTGEFLMVHGDCSSAGCYAMTDEQISEIFSLARESFAGGQRAFQVQAYPFRMTPKNIARHRTNPNMAFWRNLKQGYDHFEVTRQEPKVNVCGRQYVFDAQPMPGARFDADGACPPYQVPSAVADAVAAKSRADDAQVAALSQTAPVAPVKTGADGGMHPVFLAEIKRKQGASEFAFSPEAPGTIPETTRPPKMDESVALSSLGAPAPGAEAAVPAAAPAQLAPRPTAAAAVPAAGAKPQAVAGDKPQAAASKPQASNSPLPKPSLVVAGRPANVAASDTLQGASEVMPTTTFTR